MRLTPKRAIRVNCQECMGDIRGENICLSELCPLHPSKGIGLTYLQMIKAHCAKCSPDMNTDNCDIEECPLFPFRYGKNPRRQEVGKVMSKNLDGHRGKYFFPKNHGGQAA